MLKQRVECRRKSSKEAILIEQRKSYERSAGAGGNEEGRICPDLRRQAGKVGGQRTAFRGLGDVPLEGIAGRSQPDLRFADQRMVWADHPALGRRRKKLVSAGDASGRNDRAGRPAEGREQQI